MGDFSRMLNETETEFANSKITPENLAKLVILIDKGTISNAIAKKVFEEMFATGKDAEDIVKDKGLVQITDESAIKEMVQRVIDNNQKSVEDYRAGKDKAIGFLVGQIMKESKGKANPQIINKLLIELLNK